MIREKDGPESEIRETHASPRSPLKGWKKILYGASIMIATIGSFTLLIFTFMLNDALDKTQASVLGAVDALQRDIGSIEDALISAESEIDNVNQTVDGLGSSLVPLSGSLVSLGDSVGGMASSISQTPILGVSVDTSGIQSAASSLKDSGVELGKTASGFEGHKQGIADMKAKVSEVRQSVSDQKASLSQTRKSLEDVFGLMKVANLLFFFVVVSMFVMLVINSAAGLI